MNNIVVDTNPLVYVYNATPDLGKDYALLLGRLSEKNVLVIPKIVYGELSLIFQNTNELETFLDETGIIISEINQSSYVIAAERWARYNERRSLICHRCGCKIEPLKCRKCGTALKYRQHILTDFLIGAFAIETKDKKIVTHDSGYYSTYFPELNIISCK